jgi:hypothetical protein
VLAIPAAQADAVLEHCWRLDTLDTMDPLIEAAVPSAQPTR